MCQKTGLQCVHPKVGNWYKSATEGMIVIVRRAHDSLITHLNYEYVNESGAYDSFDHESGFHQELKEA